MDPAHRETDRLLEELEKRLTEEYTAAMHEVQDKMADYLRRFELKDRTWRRWVKEGRKTEAEYRKWRIGQMAIGERWDEMRRTIAEDMHNVNQIARGMIDETRMDAYAINHNWGTYEAEHGAQVDTSYTLYDRDTVARLVRDDPDILPAPGKATEARIQAGLEERWNRQQIQSVMTQSILQGESIPQIATRLAEAVGDANRKAAIRNARTMTTAAENAGRVDAYKRAQGMGIKMRQQWMATLDGRTRHEHRLLDGQIVDVGKPFKVEGEEIRYPGDPTAAAYLVYNCRCTVIGAIDGHEQDLSNIKGRHNARLGGMSYAEWKKAKDHPEPILKPDEIAAKMKRAYYPDERKRKK